MATSVRLLGICMLTVGLVVILKCVPVRSTTCMHASSQQYYVKCGWWVFQWGRCSRTRTVYRTVCCQGWGGSTSSGCSTPRCGNKAGFCRNGGTCLSNGRCSCSDGYHGLQCQHSCTEISNCEQERCSSATSGTCDRCEGDYGALGRAYRRSSNGQQCIKQCSWRPDSNACYPGTCTDYNCQCTSGFGGQNCRTLTDSQVPTISSIEVKLISGSSTVELSTNEIVMEYTNMRNFDSIHTNWTTSYQPVLPNWRNVPFISDAKLGITNSYVLIKLKDNIQHIQCGNAGSSSNPRVDLVACNVAVSHSSFSDVDISSGDQMDCEVFVINGGKLELYNRDQSNTIITRYYNGQTAVAGAVITFDFDTPEHCTGSVSCRSSMLNVGHDITTYNDLSIHWSDWFDTVAGIKAYHLEVRQMALYGNQLSEVYNQDPVYYVNDAVPYMSIYLPRSGVYSFLLTVEDSASNQRLARRFVLFDNDTTGPTIHEDKSIRVTSASQATNFQWMTVISGAHTLFNVTWEGHFENEVHHRRGYSNAIGDHGSGLVEIAYDQTFGNIRREGVPNTLGVTQFRSHFKVDHNGGQTSIHPGIAYTPQWQIENLSARQSYDISVSDGDSVRFWIKATDIIGRSTLDSVLVHVDSSPPVIEQFWLQTDNEVGLAVHNSYKLHDMRIHFKAYDVHSGLKTIHYQLYDTTNSTVKLGMALPVRKVDTTESTCEPANCICTPQRECFSTEYEIIPNFYIGRHDFDYAIQLTVTNNALIEVTDTLKITIDASPPNVGAVHDGIPGSKDVDFQQDNTLNAYWDGFFDKESGIKFYKYIFDNRCWKTVLPQNMTKTTLMHASWKAPSIGTYYMTVVAYNHALEPSDPVCSDGITIDSTPPELSQVKVKNARTTMGLVKDVQDRVWVVRTDMVTTRLQNASEKCRNKATPAHLLTWFNIPASYDYIVQQDVDCDTVGNTTNWLYIAADKHLFFSWFGCDKESEIYDYHIALSSVASSALPDISTYQSTSGMQNYTFRHPKITHGSVIYAIVKATNKAQLTTTMVYGPIIVDVTPPDFEGEITVYTESLDVYACWENEMFSDDIDNELTYELGIGHTATLTEVMPFTDIKPFIKTLSHFNETCVKVPSERLQGGFHAGQMYYISIKAINTVGLSVVAVSSAHRHLTQLPSGGIVLDIGTSSEQLPFGFGVNAPDVDVQTSNTTIRARWYGFYHPHLPLIYLFGVGSSPGEVDVSNGYVNVGTANEYEIKVQLEYVKTYYVSISATSETGNITVTSDGVTPMNDGAILLGSHYINDGLPCNTEQKRLLKCNDDIDFQISTSEVNVHWNISGPFVTFVTNVFWAIEEKLSSDDGLSFTWSLYRNYQDLGYTNHHTQPSLFLVNGGFYRSKIKLCYHAVCFQPLTSDGFLVISQPPIGGPISIVTRFESGNITMKVSFQQFTHSAVRTYASESLVDHYEWTLVESGNGAVLLPWQRVRDVDSKDGMEHFTLNVKELGRQSCYFLLRLKGYDVVGLSTTISSDITNCKDADDIQSIVIDSNHEVLLEKNGEWKESDKDYVNSLTDLSAVWPTLRHNNYIWAVIEDNNHHNLENGLQSPCDHPMMLKCGVTENEYINVKYLQLTHGKRYRICIHAYETTKHFEKWSQRLPEVSACSDGVVIDNSPPSIGKVWIGMAPGLQHQISTSEIVVNWEYFTDVEENGMPFHHSGVIFYELAIGTSPGKDDVIPFFNTGYSNHTVATNLKLKNGRRYFATVRGTDTVGLSSTSISDPLVVDDTPPSINTETSIVIDGAFLRLTSSVTASWGGIFWDDESGIRFYEWAIGSQPGYSDITPFLKTTYTSVSDEGLTFDLKEGHGYFFTIKATNGVGLTTSKTFGAFRVDASPPVAGHVYDTFSPISDVIQKDYDWVSKITSLCAAWEGFHDPHSSIIAYSWKVGLCQGCGDIISEQFVGIDEVICADHLQLVPGFKYFITVTACNAAELCTLATSDGITFDDSPPVIGNVYDGNSIADVDFIPNRFLISAHWWGFHDSESQISHYEWRAGTHPKASDILPSTNVHHQEIAINFLENPLPVDATVYITIRAYNQAGLWTEATTDGFMVDETKPIIVQNVTRNPTLGSRSENSQVIRDAVLVSWKFCDYESEIYRQHINLKTHVKGDVVVDSVQIGASDTQYTLTNLSFHDGSWNTIEVIGCNGAGLCTATSSEEFLVDSSPPTTGTFAVDSEHAADLGRHQDGWMTWSYDAVTDTSKLKLAWLGFTDIHSGISHYFVTVGTNFDESDLTQDDIIVVNHTQNSPNDAVQKSEIPIAGNISLYPRVYISIWALNKVGLKSARVHSAFDLASSTYDNDGALVLVRRCEAESCEGQCVCAPAGGLCPVTSIDCYDISEDNPNEEIEVIDILDIRLTEANISIEDDIDFSPTISLMAGIWITTTFKGDPILRYEWSVGMAWSEGSLPEGVYDPATEQIWHDAGHDNSVIVTFDKGKEITPDNTYQLFVRAWYSDDKYAVFRSDGITPYIFPPKPSVLKGAHINELLNSNLSKADIDYSTDINAIAISWEGVFIRNPDAIDFYEVALGRVPGGEQLRNFSEHKVTKEQDCITFSNLNLRVGQRYFASVRAYNKAALYATIISDGFIVDTQPPSTGIVYDGKGLHDLEYQSSTKVVSASWHGFNDLESGIDYYIWCVGATDDPDECNVLEQTNVGIFLSAQKEITRQMTPGRRYFSKICAVDAVGQRSDTAVSTGFVPDLTPPLISQRMQHPENLVLNPSFEEVEEVVGLISKPIGWVLNPTNSSQILNVGKNHAKDGNSIAAVYGKISQTVVTNPGKQYKLIFFASHVASAENIYLHQEGLVEAPGLKQVFQLFNRPNHGVQSRGLWQRNIFYFKADGALSEIALSTLGSHGIYVDMVKVEKVDFNIHNGLDSIDVQLQVQHDKSSVQASWQFIDEESPIKDYSWAIGSIRGGTQLQDFRSVGTATFAVNTNLITTHVSRIFVTVTARNMAGLVSVAYSKEVIVDTTPPEIVYIREENNHGEDIDFTESTDFSISWMSRDNETGISHCDWAIGFQPGSSDLILPTRVLNASKTSLHVKLPNNISDGYKVYTTVWCQNLADLSSHASSDGVTLVTLVPDSSNAFVDIIAPSITEYAVREMFQPQTKSIQASWRGFTDVNGIHLFQCKITGPLIENAKWKVCGNTGSTTVEFTGLSLFSGGNYRVDVRALNYAGLASTPVGNNVTVITEPPGLTGQSISSEWLHGDTLIISWSGTFASDSLLIYEISIGTRLGGSNVMQWVETLETQVVVSRQESVTDYYVTLSAINVVGLSKTINKVING